MPGGKSRQEYRKKRAIQKMTRMVSPARAAPGSFDSLEIDPRLRLGLRQNGFTHMSAIQYHCIPALLGGSRAVLGVSRTGSGKTLAFAIPLLQRLVSLKWQKLDGLGALVILPTRELCVQTFHVMRKVGHKLDLSMGLVTGGHNVQEERQLLESMNILVATPGRLLQQLSESSNMATDNLKYLVFDEVDALLQMGFLNDIIDIVRYFPVGDGERQVCFMTATSDLKTRRLIAGVLELQGLSVDGLRVFVPVTPGALEAREGLGRLGSAGEGTGDGAREGSRNALSAPSSGAAGPHVAIVEESGASFWQEVSGAAGAAATTGSSTRQTYTLPPKLMNIVTTVHPADKLDMLYSFVISHRQHKMIAFFATCREAAFAYEAFRRIRPGTSVFGLTSKMKQTKRHEVFDSFVAADSAVLICTDIASRGVDLPMVHWVIQVDCPDSTRSYVHRAGRAARMGRAGCSILFLTAQEQAFGRKLTDSGISWSAKTVKLKKATSIRQTLAQMCIKYDYVRVLAEKALMAYAKFLMVSPDREVFPSVEEFDLEGLAKSYGLTKIPALVVSEGDGKEAKSAAGAQVPRSAKSAGSGALAMEAEGAGRAGPAMAAEALEDNRSCSAGESDVGEEGGSQDSSVVSEEGGEELALEASRGAKHTEHGGSEPASAGAHSAAESPSADRAKPAKPLTRFDHLRKRENRNLLEYAKLAGFGEGDGNGEGDDLLVVSRKLDGNLTPEERKEVEQLLQDRVLLQLRHAGADKAPELARRAGIYRSLDDSPQPALSRPRTDGAVAAAEDRFDTLRSRIAAGDETDKREYNKTVKRMRDGVGSDEEVSTSAQDSYDDSSSSSEGPDSGSNMASTVSETFSGEGTAASEGSEETADMPPASPPSKGDEATAEYSASDRPRRSSAADDAVAKLERQAAMLLRSRRQKK